jgi:hypothetical protein
MLNNPSQSSIIARVCVYSAVSSDTLACRFFMQASPLPSSPSATSTRSFIFCRSFFRRPSCSSALIARPSGSPFPCLFVICSLYLPWMLGLVFLGLDIRKVQRVGTLPSIPPVVNFNWRDPSVACRRGFVGLDESLSFKDFQRGM